MKKKLIVMFIALALGSTSIAYAKDFSCNKNTLEKTTILQNDNLRENNLKNNIKDDMNNYYEKYSDKLIDFEEFDNLSKEKQNELKANLNENLNESIMVNRNNNNNIVNHIFGSSSGGSSEAKGNNIDYSNFKNGSIILVHRGFCPYGYWRHAGTYNSDKGKFISAQISDSGNGEGVIYEPKSWYRKSYDKAAGLNVKGCVEGDSRFNSMMNWLDSYLGYKYSLLASKSLDSNSEWYCSLIPWKAYKKCFNIDIDGNGGLKVAPDDIMNSKATSVFTVSGK